MLNPIFLADLDDTLFQTLRKMEPLPDDKEYRSGALDRSLKPRSFMTEEQGMFTDWLLANSELIPVTARGTEEISRVTIPFKSWAITTHGAVILRPDKTPDPEWKSKIIHALSAYTQAIYDLQTLCTQLLADRGVNGWARINFEYDEQPIYLVMKHRDSTKIQEIYDVADEVATKFDLSGFYVHRNSNNIAWLPKCIEKGIATEYLLSILREKDGVRPVIGLGDSVSDYKFLQHCSWWGVPKKSQFASHINLSLNHEIKSTDI